MCRLFGMSGGRKPVAARFWLLAAPDSIERQSHREPDGTGLGVFDPGGRAHVHRSARPAFRDPEFRREALTVRSRTFVSHIRFASTGAVELRNTHRSSRTADCSRTTGCSRTSTASTPSSATTWRSCEATRTPSASSRS